MTSPRTAASRRPGRCSRRKPLPQAVVCANDQMAIGALRELQRAGVAGPRGRGGDRVRRRLPSRVIDPPLTTVSQPFRDLGGRATRRLLARIDDPALRPAVTEVLPTQVVIRASCGCPPRRDSTRRRRRACQETGRRSPMRRHLTRWRGGGGRPGGRSGRAGGRARRRWLRSLALGPAAALAVVDGAAPSASATTVPAPPVRMDDGVQRQLLRGGRLRRGLPAGPMTRARSTTAAAAPPTRAPVRWRATPARPPTCPRTAAAT